jgi:hypothetical protein
MDASGGILLYPEAAEAEEGFLDGGRISVIKVRLKLKGTDPKNLFYMAERACRAADSYDGGDFLLETSDYPSMECSNENGMYIVSCRFTAEYYTDASNNDVSGGSADAMRIVYESPDGEEFDLSGGEMRAVSVDGILPYRSISIDESGIYDGGEVVSERCGTREITVKTALCGGFVSAQKKLSGIFGKSGEGTFGRLYFYTGDDGKSIRCIPEKVSATAESGIVYATITFICPYPFFESIESRTFHICGAEDLLEFDDWELTEENGTELSQIKTGNSVFAENDGGYGAGCVITVEFTGKTGDFRVYNADTKEFVGVKGSFGAGDIVYIDTEDGEKGITLSSIYDLSMSEDITFRIEWGSEFFEIASGGSRVYITSADGTDNINADVTFTERSEGI